MVKASKFFHLRRFVIFFFLIILYHPVRSQHNEWIVQLHANQSLKPQKQKNNLITEVSLISKSLNLWKITTQEKISSEQFINSLNDKSNIKHYFPNLSLDLRDKEPNDILYSEQWNLRTIKANLAWEQTTGGLDPNGNEIVIAILDEGFDPTHEDLIDNYWINSGEIPDDNIDNDNNGYIDDVMGVNIQSGKGQHAILKHGSQVSGIVGARGNNDIGISGIVWDAKILMISGVSNIAEIIKSMEYLYDLKFKYLNSGGTEGANIVVNNYSGGLKRIFPSDFPSWCEAYDLLGSVGILSVGAVPNENYDVDVEGDMPTLCDSEYLLTVTNTNQTDVKALDSAFGSISVDLGAPGENIMSTSLNSSYETISGTSASAPHVTGAVGLLYSLKCSQLEELTIDNPPLAAKLIKEVILNGVSENESLTKTNSGGRLNLINSMLSLRELCGSPTVENLNFTVYPNNFSNLSKPSVLTINYTSEVIGEHRLLIYDFNGKVVINQTFVPPLFEEGILYLDIDGINFSPGLYVVQMQNIEGVRSSKMAIF